MPNPVREVDEPSPRAAEFDGYKLGQKIGSGGMGHVYLAHDTVLDRPVAIKFIQASHSDLSSRERFLVEARAIARLQHPNVVSIYRVGEVQGEPYLVSEFVRGTSLDKMVKPLSSGQALHVAVGLARGLAAAHRQKVLHRDLKPANAILADDGEVKLLDFGLAKLMDMPHVGPPTSALQISRLSPTHPTPKRGTTLLASTLQPLEESRLAGTPHYMAPELWLEAPATYRSDVYSLGMVLYHLCSGRLPFDTRVLEQLRYLVLSQDVPPIGSMAQVDPRLALVIDRCVRKEPALRFSSAEDLREALEQLLPSARNGAVPKGNPYRGLHTFEAEHRALFFGRNADVRAILDRLRSEPFVLVAASSGVGKSSLCRAGVIPALSDQAIEPGRTWTAVTVTPGKHPIAALAAGLAPHLREDEAAVANRLSLGFSTLGRELRSNLGPKQGLVLFIDQMEELLTLSEPREAEHLAHVLADLSSLTPGLRLLGTVRGDFLSRLASMPGVGHEVGRALYLLRPLSPEGVREAVVGPARTQGVVFESEEFVEALVKSTDSADGMLPLLEFALAELWETRDVQRGVIPLSALERIEGVAGALARYADGVVEALLPEQRAAARRIAIQLVTAEETRARRTEEELVVGDANAPGALAALVRSRLLIAREAPEGSAYEIAHEVLIRGWPALGRWLNEAKEVRALRERLRAANAEWERLGRNREALWSSRQLAEVVKLDAAHLPPAMVTFLEASKRAVRRRRRMRWATALVGLMAIGLTYGSVRLNAGLTLKHDIETFHRQATAELARAGQLATRAQALRKEAFEKFDRWDRSGAEVPWAQALALSIEEERVYTQVSQALEAALVLQHENAELRLLLAQVLYRRALLAERGRRRDQEDELLGRLKLYDVDGVLSRQWARPAHLQIRISPAQAHVQLERYVEDEKGSFHRVEVRDTGAQPPEPLEIPRGSYVVVADGEGLSPVRYPLLLGRGDSALVQLELPSAAAVPSDFVYIPPGPFLFGAADEADRKGFLYTVPIHQLQGGAYLIARHETTFAQWLEFLVSLSPAERVLHLPRSAIGSFQGGLVLKQPRANDWELTIQPTTQAFSAHLNESIEYPGRKTRRLQRWLKMPVAGIAWSDAQAYLHWLSKTGRVQGARFCTEQEWERAGRGADGREFPNGSDLHPSDANFDETYERAPLGMGPDEVGSFPNSRSPFGLDDMSGNVWEWTTSSLSATEHVLRGGSYYFNKRTNMLTNREVVEPTVRNNTVGLRVCATPKS